MTVYSTESRRVSSSTFSNARLYEQREIKGLTLAEQGLYRAIVDYAIGTGEGVFEFEEAHIDAIASALNLPESDVADALGNVIERLPKLPDGGRLVPPATMMLGGGVPDPMSTKWKGGGSNV